MIGQARFDKLLEPYHIGQVKTRNRMVKTAAGTNLWDQGEHRISEKAKAFYEAIARGGVGLLIVESPIMEYPFDEAGDLRYRIDDDKYVPDISELTRVISNGQPTTRPRSWGVSRKSVPNWPPNCCARWAPWSTSFPRPAPPS